MVETVTIEQAQKDLPSLIKRAIKAGEIVIADSGRPLVKLVPLASHEHGRRIAGLDSGQVWMADDFNDPLPDDALGG